MISLKSLTYYLMITDIDIYLIKIIKLIIIYPNPADCNNMYMYGLGSQLVFPLGSSRNFDKLEGISLL